MAQRNEKKAGFPVFWVSFAVFVIILIGFWMFFISYVNRCLQTYETAQPEYVVEEFIEKLEAGEAEALLNFQTAASRFEDASIYKETYFSNIEGKTFTYEKAAGSYDAKAPVYKIYAGDDHIATMSLKEISSYDVMFILSVQQWETVAIEPVYETGNKELTVKLPDSYQLLINGIEADERELTENSEDIEAFQYAADYVTVPKLVEYKIDSLFHDPEVEIVDQNGEVLDAGEYIIEDNRIFIDTFAVSEMDDELSAYVLTNAKNYSNFFSRDLEGCRESIAPISYMFPEDSYYLELAETYRNEDMWMYSAHETPVFSNEKVSNYIVYSEEFFSCDVYFDKNMILTRNGEARLDVTNTRYYYVKLNGEWLIADMISVID